MAENDESRFGHLESEVSGGTVELLNRGARGLKLGPPLFDCMRGLR